MGKSKQNSSKSSNPKKAKVSSSSIFKQSKCTSGGSGGGGLDEIDSLFAHKKQSHKELQQQITNEKEIAKKERQRRKQARIDEEADEIALRGSAADTTSGSSSNAAVGKKRKADATAPSSLHSKATQLSSLTYTRSDIEHLNGSQKKEVKDKWAKDGLGGIFNGEGYTGRRDDGGHRVFKAHLLNKEKSGQTPDCPFDCDCCFI